MIKEFDELKELKLYIEQLEDENKRLKDSNKSLRTNNKGLLEGQKKLDKRLHEIIKKNKESDFDDKFLDKIMENTIEITWINQKLVNSGKIIPDKYSMPFNADFIKETIIDIALNFEKSIKM